MQLVQDRVLTVSREGCVLRSDLHGYRDFVRALGLLGLTKARRERLGMGGRELLVQVAQGLPNASAVSFYEPRRPPAWVFGYQGADSGEFDWTGPPHPGLVLRTLILFMSGLLYGWQAYFDPDEGSAVEWVEFWLPDVRAERPAAELFVQVPAQCYRPVQGEHQPAKTT